MEKAGCGGTCLSFYIDVMMGRIKRRIVVWVSLGKK
jgi:hypothetical protein